MRDLLLAELRRFRGPAVIAAAAHLLLLLFLNRMSDLLQQPFFESQPLLAVSMLVGLALALVQVGSYRKPAAWMWLLHRPLAPARIFAALALSALLLLTAVVLLPQLLLVAGIDLLTTRVVDTRHYGALLHLLAFAMMAWLAGCHAVLSRHRLAIVVLVLPLTLALHLVSVWWLLVPVLACLAWMTVIALHSVRANRDAPPPRLLPLLLTAVPLQLGFLLLVFSGIQMLIVSGGILLGSDPLNREIAPAGGLIETQRATPAEVLMLGLAASADPRAQAWQQQLPLLEPIQLGARLQRYPLRHQLSNLQLPTGWSDKERGIAWTFSHDLMRYVGRDPASGANRGEWGAAGAADPTPFQNIPIALDDARLMTRDTLFAIDLQQQSLHALLQLDSDEHFIALPEFALDRTLILSNRRLLALRKDRDALSPSAPLYLDWALPLPRGAAQLDSVQLVQLMDGWLLSFVYGDGHRQVGLSQLSVVREPWQQIQWLEDGQQARIVAERAIRRDYPAFYQHAGWLSPLLLGLAEWPEQSLEKGLTWPMQTELLVDSAPARAAAFGLLLIALALGWLWLRKLPIPPARRRFWLLSCLLLGLPALLSLICLEPRGVRRG